MKLVQTDYTYVILVFEIEYRLCPLTFANAWAKKDHLTYLTVSDCS